MARKSRCGDGKFPVSTVSIPRSQWSAFLGSNGVSLMDLSTKVKEIKDQGSTPSCASQMAVGAIQIVRRWNGQVFKSLSAASIFHFVGGARGSSIDDNLEYAKTTGPCTTALWANNDWRSNPPAGYKDEGKLYRIIEWDDCPDFDSATSVLLSGRPIAFGVDWEGGGGHAIVGVALVKTSTGYGWKILNSWGTDYGTKGFGVLPEKQISRGIIDRYGAWAPRVVTVSGGFSA
jgi:hypothetical protein